MKMEIRESMLLFMETKGYMLQSAYLYLYPLNWKGFCACIESYYLGLQDNVSTNVKPNLPTMDSFLEFVLAITHLYIEVNFRPIYNATPRTLDPAAPSQSKVRSLLANVRIPTTLMQLIREFVRPQLMNGHTYFPEFVPADLIACYPKITEVTNLSINPADGPIGNILPLVKLVVYRPNVVHRLAIALDGEYTLCTPASETLESLPIFVCNTKTNMIRTCVPESERLHYCIALNVIDLGITQNVSWPLDNMFKTPIKTDYTLMCDQISEPSSDLTDHIILKRYLIRTSVKSRSSAPPARQTNNPGKGRPKGPPKAEKGQTVPKVETGTTPPSDDNVPGKSTTPYKKGKRGKR